MLSAQEKRGTMSETLLPLRGEEVKHAREILECLQRLSWRRGNVKSRTFGRTSITLGVTRGAPGAIGFDSEGFNKQAVPDVLSKNDREQCAKLWALLREEARELGFEFTSAQVNKNFRTEAPHHHLRTDKDHQWCLSFGDFTEGGQFCWREGERCFSVSTKDRWQKVDGRHVHWVKPHEPKSADRYSIVLFRNTGQASEIFYAGDLF
jgi:hypothetical protein